MAIFPIILAAGQGTRMNSSLPKVLHPIGAKPMLHHVIDSCEQLGANSIGVIVGHEADRVKESVSNKNVSWIIQKEQKVLTTKLDDPYGYGRIIRDDTSKIIYNVEEKDANEDEKLVKEVNTGFLAARGDCLKRWLKNLTPNNAQGEFYLTDCIAMAVAEGVFVESVVCENPLEVEGVNNRTQQAKLERAYQLEQAEKLMLAGVTIADQSRLDIRGELSAGKDVFLDINTVIKGKVTLGDNVIIQPNCIIENSVIADNTIVKSNSIVESADVGKSCEIGPYARIRPGTVLNESSKVGNFVEIKKSTIGVGSKISHLSYIGDTVMGESVNVGAGTITCNYDGVNKHQTIIGDDVFVGSDTQFIAPVKIENGSTIGAGSTITKDTPQDELTLSRAKQVTIKGWVRPVKNTKKETK